jgi:hypothetical protein
MIECSNDNCCAIIRASDGPDTFINREKLAAQWNLRPNEQRLKSALELILFAIANPETVNIEPKLAEVNAALTKASEQEWAR